MSDQPNIQIRPVQREDYAWLTSLWETEFGDSEEYVLLFLELLSSIGFGLIAEYKGERAGAAYAITDLTLKSEAGNRKVSYIYAVATKKEFRNKGIATSICRELKSKSLLNNCDIVLVKPDGNELFPFYQNTLQTTEVIYKSELHYSAESIISKPDVNPVTAEQYNDLREALLKKIPHLALTNKCLLLEKALCCEYGGDLYCISGYPAAVYMNDETGEPEVKELICHPAEIPAIMNQICNFFQSQSAILSYYTDGKGTIPYLASDRNDIPSTTHWGLLFD